MSRIAKKPILIPSGTEVKIEDNKVFVKGPLGSLERSFLNNHIEIKVVDNTITLTPKQSLKNKLTKSLLGTYASLIKNMIEGVNKFFEKKLIIEGIGFKADLIGNEIVLSLGFSHPVKVPIPSDLKVSVEKTNITINGCDKEKVGQFAAYLRSLKKPEPYKGKGIRYFDEIIRRKQGKKAT